MKVLHIIDSGGLYGAEIMLLNLISEQIKSGLNPAIASIGEKHIADKLLEKEADKRGIPIEKFRMIRGPNVIGAYKILKFARNAQFDILHSHGYKGNILFGFIPKSVRKMPLIATLHGWTSTRGLSIMKVYEWLDVKSLTYINAVVLVNSAMKAHPGLKTCNGLNLYVVDNGIPLLDSCNNLKVEGSHRVSTSSNNGDSIELDPRITDFCKDRFTLGAIGRLSAEKGYEHLVDAANELIKIKNYDIQLVILGEGNLRQQLEKQIKNYGIENYVMMPGYIKNAKEYLPYFNIFILPSLTEGLPITILEAMQKGVPIISTAVGGISEVLDNGKAGMLIRASESSGIVNAVLDILKNSNHKNKLVENAKHRVKEKYSSERMAYGYLEIYNRVIKNKKYSMAGQQE